MVGFKMIMEGNDFYGLQDIQTYVFNLQEAQAEWSSKTTTGTLHDFSFLLLTFAVSS